MFYYEGKQYDTKDTPAEIVRRVLLRNERAWVLFGESEAAVIDARFTKEEAEAYYAAKIVSADKATLSPNFSRLREFLAMEWHKIEPNNAKFAEFAQLAKEFAGVDLALTTCKVCPERTFNNLKTQFQGIMKPFSTVSDGRFAFLDTTRVFNYNNGKETVIVHNDTSDFDNLLIEGALTIAPENRESVITGWFTGKDVNGVLRTDTQQVADFLGALKAPKIKPVKGGKATKADADALLDTPETDTTETE